MFLVCGEALFDLFLESESGPGASLYAARSGGSPFNVAIGLSRLGTPAALLTGLSRDLLGQRLRRVLEDEGVATTYAIDTERPTTISLVGLDFAGVPAYQFYDRDSAGTGITVGDLPRVGPEVTGLHFGSYSIAAEPVADAFLALASAERDRFISLDPNIRPTVVPDMQIWRHRVGALIPFVDLLKISFEDLAIVHPGMSAAVFARETLARGPRLVVVTDGGERARAWTASGLYAEASPPAVAVIDTVGAGDTFQAALISRLLRHPDGPGAGIDALDQAGLEAMLDYAARAAALTCSRRGADLPRASELSD